MNEGGNSSFRRERVEDQLDEPKERIILNDDDRA